MDAPVTAEQSRVGPARRRGGAGALSHNLNGQRLGRKGRDTRERILSAAAELVLSADQAAISLSAVARQAGMSMSSLYLYFPDLTELLLATLEPVMARAEAAYLRDLRERWPDDSLEAHCTAFVNAFHAFWQENAAFLHLRNGMADRQDERMLLHRVRAAQPVIAHIVAQMDHDAMEAGSPAAGMATVFYTGLERVVVIVTNAVLPRLMPGRFGPRVDNFLEAEAQILTFAIRQYRALAKA
jgi:AcrR family transcriptional regulator